MTNDNYFTIIEEHFQRARGSRMSLLSPRDYALLEAWHDGGVPLEAVVRGIDKVFENRRKRSPGNRSERVNSLAYCAQMITAEAQALAKAYPAALDQPTALFSIDDIREFIARNAAALKEAGYADLAISLQAIDLNLLCSDLEQVEQCLITVEEALIEKLRETANNRVLAEARCAV